MLGDGAAAEDTTISPAGDLKSMGSDRQMHYGSSRLFMFLHGSSGDSSKLSTKNRKSLMDPCGCLAKILRQELVVTQASPPPCKERPRLWHPTPAKCHAAQSSKSSNASTCVFTMVHSGSPWFSNPYQSLTSKRNNFGNWRNWTHLGVEPWR